MMKLFAALLSVLALVASATNTTHITEPQLPDEFFTYPGGGELWHVGDHETVRWNISSDALDGAPKESKLCLGRLVKARPIGLSELLPPPLTALRCSG